MLRNLVVNVQKSLYQRLTLILFQLVGINDTIRKTIEKRANQRLLRIY